MAKKGAKPARQKKETSDQKRKRETKEKALAQKAALASAEAHKDDEPVAEEESKSGSGKKTNDYRAATGVLESNPFSRDIKIGGFTLQSYGQELVRSTTIEITIGRRYGVLGANGSGKSSLLRCIAAREVPIPEHMDMYLLDMEAEPSERSALEAVVDVVRDEHKRLEELGEELLITLGPEHDAVALLYEKLDDMNPQTFEARAGKLLYGLGFTQAMVHKKTKDMSGGWRMRVSLARALFVKPTLLLLDEPTNHLDLEACVWLENYLANYPFCLLIVSHSQDFLNGVCTNIMVLEDQKLSYYKGNYDTYVKTRKELEVNQMKHWQQEQDDIKHLKQFISSCGTFSNLVRQAKSKQKILDKMYAKGLTPRPKAQHEYKFEFAECEILPPPVMAFVDVAFAYSGLQKDLLYKNVNLSVDMDSRVAIVGPNGAGKSTLLKLMCSEISPTVGLVKAHLYAKIAKYHQHSTEQLDQEKTPLELFVEMFKEQRKPEDEWRQHLGRYGISGSQQLSKIAHLSDGIQSRIVFALMAMGAPNLLLLDEPTNHLDMECIDSLATAINKFAGGMVLVSHDFRLIDQVAKEIWVVDNNSITIWKGGIREYKKAIAKKLDL